MALCGSEQVAQAQQREQVQRSGWVILRRIELMGFKIEKMVDPKNPMRVTERGLNYFDIVCLLGHRDIALLMVKSGVSISMARMSMARLLFTMLL